VFEKALILGLYSITPVHAGSGAELSVIDLPIQREKHTGFPVIWGQSLKGVLRRAYEGLDDSQSKQKTEIIFGPPTDRASEHAGAISVGDAKVLLFPVRSLKGVFAYVTCPLVLDRFIEDIEFIKSLNGNLMININTDNFKNELDKLRNDLNNQKTTSAIVFSDELMINNKNIVLEDIIFIAKNANEYKNYDELKIIPEIILNILGNKNNQSDNQPKILNKLQSKLVIVPDDVFKAFVTMTTEIIARVKINAKSGTVESGGLWYEEYLPSDCILYSMIAVGKPRIPDKNDEERNKNEKRILQVFNAQTLDDALNKIIEDLSKINLYIQIGGNETVGKGFVKTAVFVPYQK